MKNLFLFLFIFSFSINIYATEEIQIKGISVDKVINCENIKSISNENSRVYASCLNVKEKQFYFKTSFLDKPTNIYISVNDERVVSAVLISKFDFAKALSSLEAKYGPAYIETSIIQNRMGASFDQKIATWSRDKTVLQIKLHGSKLNESSLFLGGQAAIDHGREVAKPSNDL